MLRWRLIKFQDLTNQELYEVLKLRTDVFVVEQICPYPELDNKDQLAFHFCGYNSENRLTAYCRILSPGISYEEASIGRVLVSEKGRGLNYGKVLMDLAIEITHNLFQNTDIRIGAQCYLEKFYGNLGFNPASESYIEDGIPHLEMLKNNPLK